MDTPMIVGLAIMAIVVLAIGRMIWRVVWGNEEMQPGGSEGRQMFGRSKDG
jgi:hypothetical protein